MATTPMPHGSLKSSVALPSTNGAVVPPLPAPDAEITAELMSISPTMAADLLRNRLPNRPVSKARVRLMIEDLRAGRWKTNGESIILDQDLRLLDGQHRLRACQESGIAITALVVVGVAPSAMASIDQGRSKGGADILAMAAMPQAQQLSSAAKWLWRYTRERMRQAAVLLRNEELPVFVAEHPGLQASLEWGRAVRALLPQSCGAMLHYVMSKKDPTLAKQYFLALAHGEELKRAHPAHVLREKFLREKAATSHLAVVGKAALVVVAWNALRRDAHLAPGLVWRGIQDPKVPFPKIM